MALYENRLANKLIEMEKGKIKNNTLIWFSEILRLTQNGFYRRRAHIIYFISILFYFLRGIY